MHAILHTLRSFFARRVTFPNNRLLAQFGEAMHFITLAQAAMEKAAREAIEWHTKVVPPSYGPINIDGLNLAITYDPSNIGRMLVHVEGYYPLINEMLRQALLDQRNFRGALETEQRFGYIMIVDCASERTKAAYLDAFFLPSA